MGVADIVADRDYYRTYYLRGYHDDVSDHGHLARWWNNLTRCVLRSKIKKITGFAKSKAKRLRLLDVGCGPGHFLEQLDLALFEPHGVEPVGEAVAIAKKKGLDVFQGDVLATPLGSAKYDVVTLWHVLEHIGQPGVALSRIHSALDEQGIVVIATPNTHSLACKMGREYWFHLDTPRHLHLFNESNCERILENSGFKVIHRSFLPFDFPLDLFWSLMRNWRLWPVLAVYPLAKLFDRENFLVIARKHSAHQPVQNV